MTKLVKLQWVSAKSNNSFLLHFTHPNFDLGIARILRQNLTKNSAKLQWVNTSWLNVINQAYTLPQCTLGLIMYTHIHFLSRKCAKNSQNYSKYLPLQAETLYKTLHKNCQTTKGIGHTFSHQLIQDMLKKPIKLIILFANT